MSTPLELRVVAGHPDDTELAAVVAVLLVAASRPSGPAASGRRGGWGDPATLVRAVASPQPGGWGAPRL